MSLFSVHLAAMSTECCRTDSTFLWHLSNSVLSSTYLYNGAGVSRSFMYTRKHLGPSNVPCCTPPLGCPGGDNLFPILTCWVLSNRKVAIHLRILGGKSYCFNFTSSVLWLIRSKALLKSVRLWHNDLAYQSLLTIYESFQQGHPLSNFLPFRQIGCRLCFPQFFYSPFFRIIDSSVFEAIGVREIGLTSF